VRLRVAITVVTVFALVAGLGVYLLLRGRHFPGPGLARACTVQAEGTVFLNERQMANAATIAAVGIRRGLPERAVVVALATAFQESRLRNLPDGDRDSIGLFQQRPSQGWGTPEEIRDPRYAAGKFYSELVKVEGWENMRVTDAAQRVQRSAFPEAYEQWADESAVLTKALLGDVTAAVACTYPGGPQVWGEAAASALARGLQLDWGDLIPSPDGITGLAELAGLPGLALTPRDTRQGWQYAHWLVSHAAAHGVKRVRYDGLEWTAKGGAWTKLPSGQEASSTRVLAEVYTT